MKKLVLALTLALVVPLGGCAETLAKFRAAETTVSNAVGVVGGLKVKSKSAYVAINVFNAAERSATAYLKLPPCDGTTKVCRAAGAAEAIDPPFSAGIQARNDLRSYMKANKGTLADAGLYNTLVSATDSLQKIMDIYGAGGAK
jgi:hypothetical protein